MLTLNMFEKRDRSYSLEATDELISDDEWEPDTNSYSVELSEYERTLQALPAGIQGLFAGASSAPKVAAAATTPWKLPAANPGAERSGSGSVGGATGVGGPGETARQSGSISMADDASSFAGSVSVVGSVDALCVPSTGSVGRPQRIERNKEGQALKPVLEYYSRTLRPSTIAPGLTREKMVANLDPVQRRGWSSETIGGNNVKRGLAALSKPKLTPLQKFRAAARMTSLSIKLINDTQAEREATAVRILGLLDDWLIHRKLRIADLFRSHQINKGNKGQGSETSDNRLDQHEVTNVLLQSVQLPVTREEVHSLIDYLDTDGNREIDVMELDQALRRSRRRYKTRKRPPPPPSDVALPAELVASLDLPSGLDAVWLALTPEHRPEVPALYRDGKRRHTSAAHELARVITTRPRIRFVRERVEYSATRGGLSEGEVSALRRALALHDVQLATTD